MALRLNISKETTYDTSLSLLIFLMMVFPAQVYVIKIICMIIMMYTMSKKIYLTKTVFSLIVIYIIYGVWGIFIGLMNNTENPLAIITITILWPLLFLPFIGQKYSYNDYIKLCRILLFAHTVIVIYDLIFCFGVIYGLSVPQIYPSKQVFSFYDTTSRLSFLNLNSITFTSPIFILIWMTGLDIGIKRKYLFIIVCATLFLLILSGRRSMMGLAIGIIPVVFCLRFYFNKKYTKTIIQSFGLIISVIICALSIIVIEYPDVFNGYLETFLNAFDSEQEPIKFAQSKMLIETFKENPITGVGIGRELYEPAPGRTQFSNVFELQYHFTLAYTGIIGFIFKLWFLLGVLYYTFKIRRFYNNLPIIFGVGYIFMLIADFTNPVLCSFDFFLSVFILLAMINSVLQFPKSHQFILLDKP